MAPVVPAVPRPDLDDVPGAPPRNPVRVDAPGRGRPFTVELPEASFAGVTAVPRAEPLPQGGDGPGRVLVVDDNEDAAESLADVLRCAGYDVRTAHDPARGLAIAEAFAPQVAVLDIGLPGMDGWALGALLRRSSIGSPPACIAVTGYGMDPDRARSEEAGFVAHLVKPVDIDRLERILDGVLAARPGAART